MGMFFVVRKPMVLSEIWNSLILTPFVTSLTPNFKLKRPKIHLEHNNTRYNDLKLGMGMFLNLDLFFVTYGEVTIVIMPVMS